MSRANEGRCAHCGRGAKVRITRAGALCKRCLDQYPKHLRPPPVAASAEPPDVARPLPDTASGVLPPASSGTAPDGRSGR